MADVYDFGQTVTITAAFTDEAGDAADPTTLTLMVQAPGGTETTYDYADDEITKTAVGSYEMDVTPDEDGRWFCRWDGVTDDNHTVVEYYFYVTPTEFSV